MESERENAEKTRQKLDKLKEERLQKEIELKSRGEKLSQKAIKMVKKRNVKPFWDRWGDPIGYAAIGIVVIGIIFLNYTGDRRKLSDILVNEDTFIQSHNESKESNYILGNSNYFQGKSLQDLAQMFRNEISQKKTFTKCDMGPLNGVEIPAKYNFYQAYPNCDFEEEQRKSSTSYIELPLSVYRNRVCALGDREDFKPSLDFFLSCNTKLNLAEKGGYLLSTLHFMRKGFISEKCWEENAFKEEKNNCPVENLKSCYQKKISSYCHFEGEANIKREITQNGPVISIMRPYRDFFVYRSGLYEIKDRSKLEGLVFIKIVGWGETVEGLKYWIAEPLWGKSWGEDRFVKIKIGTEESIIEKYAFTLYPEEISHPSLGESVEEKQATEPRKQAKADFYIETD